MKRIEKLEDQMENLKQTVYSMKMKDKLAKYIHFEFNNETEFFYVDISQCEGNEIMIPSVKYDENEGIFELRNNVIERNELIRKKEIVKKGSKYADDRRFEMKVILRNTVL